MTISNPRILIIDDSEYVSKILEKTLSPQGFNILKAYNAKEGRNLAIKHHPDLILLDVMMPDEDGFSVIDALKANPATVGIPVIFLTAVNDIKSKVKGFEKGAVDFIAKPFYGKEVEARIRTHLKLSHATNALIASQTQKLREVHEAQNAILLNPEEMPEARFAVHYAALHEAGGDFYDVLKITEGIHGYFVSDVAGHSIKSSFLTASLKALLAQNCAPIYSSRETMKLINHILINLFNYETYLTAVYIRLNRKTHSAEIISAGHPPALYVPFQGEPVFIHLEGDLMGLFDDAQFGYTKIPVQAGDRFFIYTDGLIEQTQERKIWTENLHLLMDIAAELKDCNMNSAIQKILNICIPKETQMNDDVLILGFEV